MTLPQPQWKQATEAIHTAKTVLVVGHFSPDGDAIGSTLGLATALRAMGKRVDAANDDGMPDYLDFIVGADTMKDDISGGKWDVMVSVDSSDEERTGKAGTIGRENSKTVINLDHHATNTLFGDVYLVDPSAVSATEIVFDWLVHMVIFYHIPDIPK
jgi:phosphoesterase RecJ-like protein